MTLKDLIRAELAHQQISQSELARRLGVVPHHVCRALSEGHDPRLSTVEAIMRELGIVARARK